MRGFRRILVALDGSRDALARGLQLAGDEGCWTTVLKVLPANEGDLDLTGIKDIDAVLAGEELQVRAAVRESAAEARVLVKARVEEGAIPERIVAVATEERCDLIVIGRERLTWYHRLFGPSIAERVARSAQRPVLVIEPVAETTPAEPRGAGAPQPARHPRVRAREGPAGAARGRAPRRSRSSFSEATPRSKRRRATDGPRLPTRSSPAHRSGPMFIKVRMDIFASLATKFRRSAAPAVADPGDPATQAVATFRNGINCTQAILAAWGARHGLDRETALRIGGAFGSGMNMGETCGAVTGALMVIGLRHAKVSQAGFLSRDRTERETLDFIGRFRSRNGSVSCKELLGCDLGTPQGRAHARRDRSFKTRCPKFVRDAAEILEEMTEAHPVPRGAKR